MMFVTLATTESPKYKGFDRACDLYTNAAISVLGKVDEATRRTNRGQKMMRIQSLSSLAPFFFPG